MRTGQFVTLPFRNHEILCRSHELADDIVSRGNEKANSFERDIKSFPRVSKSFPRHSYCISFLFFQHNSFLLHTSFFNCTAFFSISYPRLSKSFPRDSKPFPRVSISWERDKKKREVHLKKSCACHLCATV